MYWFKHYSDADSSIFNQLILKEYGKEGYAEWMLLLELMCSKFDGNSILIKLTIDEVAKKLRIKPQRVPKVIKSFCELGEDQVISQVTRKEDQRKSEGTLREVRGNLDPFIMIIRVPILMDLKGRDFARARSEREEGACKIKNKKKKEIKIKIKSPVGLHPNLEDDFLKPYFENVKLEAQEAWLKTYPDHIWLKNQLQKAINWLISNDEKRKDMGKYLNGWLGRSTPGKDNYSTKATLTQHAQGLFDSNPYPEVSA